MPGKKKRGRPSKHDLALREAARAALAAEEAAAASAAVGTAPAQQVGNSPGHTGRPWQAGQMMAVPVPTDDLDPPSAQHLANTSPAAAKPATTQHSKQAAPVDAAMDARSAPASPTGRSGSLQGRVLSPNGTAAQQKAAPAATAVPRPIGEPQKQIHRDGNVSLEQGLRDGDAPAPTHLGQLSAPAAAAGKAFRQLKKHTLDAAQEGQQTVEADTTALPAGAAAVHGEPVVPYSKGPQQRITSGSTKQKQHGETKAAYLEISVAAHAMHVDIQEAGCARGRPWTKHLTRQSGPLADDDFAADQAEQQTDAATALPTAAVVPPAAAAAVPDSLEQTGSGPEGRTSHPVLREALNARSDVAPSQDGDLTHACHHKPRTSCTAPPPTQQAGATAQDQAGTGDSRARVGSREPRGEPLQGNATHRRTEGSSHGACEEERRSGNSSGNATAVQQGVGHTGESSEAAAVSLKKPSKAARLQQQHQQQQQRSRPTSWASEQGLHSAAGNNISKFHLPGDRLYGTWQLAAYCCTRTIRSQLLAGF